MSQLNYLQMSINIKISQVDIIIDKSGYSRDAKKRFDP